MSRKLFLMVLVLSLTLMLSGMAIAAVDDDDDDDDDDDATDDDDDATDDDDDATDDDDDDATDDDDDDATDDDDDDTTGDGFMDSTVSFTEPANLTPESIMLFKLQVTHGGTVGATMKGEWIQAVDLTMPSADYVVADGSNLVAPNALHGSDGDQYEIDRWEVSYDGAATISWQCFSVVTSEGYGDIREGESLVFEFEATTDEDATDGFAWTLHGDEGGILDGILNVGAGDDDDDDDVSGDDDVVDDSDDDDDGGCGC